MQNRILVTGSRDWKNVLQMSMALRDAWWFLNCRTDVVLVHGDARGADRMAAKLWEKRGLTTDPHPANWKQYGKRAGFIRNQEMVDLGAILCLAFFVADAPPGEPPNNRGTLDCSVRAKDAGIAVWDFKEK